jgi:hypothetical protein
MAVAKPKTLVLCGVSVVRDVVAGTLGNGSKPASCRTAATPFSMRHPWYPGSVQESHPWQDHADRLGVDNPAGDGAGRPGCLIGELARQRCASLAQRAAHWRREAGNIRPTMTAAALFAQDRPSFRSGSLPGSKRG